MISSPQFSRTAYRPDPERKSSAHAWAMNYLPGKTGLSVLEIGCATGQELSSLLQEFPGLRFTGLDISGRLKSPSLLYFLNRLRAEFDRPRLPHRTFVPELVRSTKGKAFR